MNFTLLSNLNYLAILVAAILYFIIGSMWFSLLFGKIWQQELKANHLPKPAQESMMPKMIIEFIINVIIAFAIAIMVKATGANTLSGGIVLGKIIAFGFVATTLGSVFNWESRSLKLFLIDVGYPVVSIIAATVLLTLWQ